MRTCRLFKTFWLIDIINENEPDIVQSWMYHSNLIASLALCFTDAKVQSVWNIRHSTLSLKNDKKQLISLVLLGSILSRIFPSKIIFCANSAALAHFKIGYSKKKSSVIGNGYPEYKGQQINLMEIEARPKNELVTLQDTIPKNTKNYLQQLQYCEIK